MKKHTYISVVIVGLVAGFIVAAQNFKVGYSGPQSQGDIIYTKASDGSTQLRLGTTSACTVDDVTASDDLVVTDDISVGGLVTVTPTAIAPTNGEAITVADTVYLAIPTGQANTYTNTVTLANPAVAGKLVTFVVGSTATNKLGLADSGNLALSAAFAGDANDSITLLAITASAWAEISRSSN